MTALVGHSGSGKSTILNLIPRFYQPQLEIKIDNQSIYEVTIKSLRDNISLVNKRLHFSMIQSKIILNMPMKVSDEEIFEASKLSNFKSL